MHGIDTTFLVQVELREAPNHSQARAWLDRALHGEGPFLALAPQVLTEFVYVVTDAKRFMTPLSMDDALDRARLWWEAREVRPVLPSVESTHLCLKWLRAHRLGRKRLLDTQLAATYAAAGVTSLLTSNSADFAVFEAFSFTDLEGPT